MIRPSRFELIALRTGDHAVRDRETGEVMHPSIGPWNEANALYVDQSRLIERLAQETGEPLHIWDVGLGAGTNAIAALTRANARSSRRPLHITSFDTTSEALELARDSPAAFPFMEPWMDAVRSVLSQGVWEGENVRWTLRLGDCLQTWSSAARAQLVFFDPFSPQSNPELWTVAALTQLRAHATHPDQGTVVMTYSASTRTRVSFLMAGFFVGTGVPVGTRSETTVAATQQELLFAPLGQRWVERWKRSDARSPHGAEEVPNLLSHPQFEP